MRRILCLHLPYLSTERARRDAARADEDERPLVLTRPAGSSLVVAQVCPRARQRGLRPGLSLGQAHAMAPGLTALPDEPQRDRAALERLAHWALRFSPLVEPVELDKLLIDITGCQLLFGGEKNIVHQAAAGLARQGFRVRAAIADTVGAACALAVAGAAPLCIVPAGQASAYLSPLPPTALRIDARAAERLDALGVRSIGDLLTLPRASLPARFGPQLVLRLQQALGEVFEGVTPYQPEEMPFSRQNFESPVADGQAILAVVERLLADVFAQMRRRDAALRRLECVLYYEGVEPRVVSVSLARPARQRAHVATLLAQSLERADFTPGVTGLMLIARQTSRWHGGQGELFEPREPGDDEALGCLIDRLASRLGHAAIVRPWLMDDHQPEMAYRYMSVADAGCEPQTDERMGAPVIGGLSPHDLAQPGAQPARPVRLFARPIPIRVIALVPDGPPTWLAYRGQEHVVARADGPERLETGWWRGPDVRRDYFRVTIETGEQFWIFRAPDQGCWYLHGVFA